MASDGPNREKRNTNALAIVAGALIALLAVLGFLALMSHRAGAEEIGRDAPVVSYAAPASPAYAPSP